ncbi:MAG: NAD(+)/NADH kinase [Bifidobacteriaceae bacterium]|jgi:diacylglycerol kinase family enzyme|nr:NAD(+)/NADH kinase [Bifidobacteriaceae bacterium]
MDWPDLLAAAGGLVGLGGGIAAVTASAKLRRTQRTLARAAQFRRDSGRLERAAFVANPTKSGYADLKLSAYVLCDELGLGEPLWLETTRRSPGTAQAAEAARQTGVSTVVAAGGDGTVRAVAAGLVELGVPMGVVPMGTANLLARNLNLPLAASREALEVAFTGRRRVIDVGRLTAHDLSGQTVLDNEAFLVISGLGFDAAMVSSADVALKRRLGWPAYFISGFNHLSDKAISLTVAEDPAEDDAVPRRVSARSVMFGNCGLLPAGLRLVPDADLADGLLDLVTAETRHGLVGWAAVAAQVGLHSVGLRWSPAWASGRLVYRQAEAFEVRCEADQLIQIDGELVGQAASLRVSLEHLALSVRVAD